MTSSASSVSECPSEDLFGTGRVAASPRDVLVRPDQHQLSAVPLTQMRPCSEIDCGHRDAAASGCGHERCRSRRRS